VEIGANKSHGAIERDTAVVVTATATAAAPAALLLLLGIGRLACALCIEVFETTKSIQ